MSDTVTNLVSGVIGALVGGAATLVGTIFVGRMEAVRVARIRLFRVILPKITEDTLLAYLNTQTEDSFARYVASMGELAREAQIAGRPERDAMRGILGLQTQQAPVEGRGVFEIETKLVLENHEAIMDALWALGYQVSHRIR